MEKNSRQKSPDKYEVIGSTDKSDITIDCNPDAMYNRDGFVNMYSISRKCLLENMLLL